jgi:hypothetical protein
VFGIAVIVHAAVMRASVFYPTKMSDAPEAPTFMTDTFVGCHAFADALEALAVVSYASAVSCA